MEHSELMESATNVLNTAFTIIEHLDAIVFKDMFLITVNVSLKLVLLSLKLLFPFNHHHVELI